MRNPIVIVVLMFAAGVLMGSCREKDVPGESISVSPETIEASVELASYKIDVASNCAWTLDVEGEDGAEVFWMTPGQSSGRGNATVTVRVNENSYSSARTARLVFTTPGGKEAIAAIIQAGNESGGSSPESASLRLGTYNLRMHQLDTDADNTWNVRKERLRESIIDCNFDVFGVQEVSFVMQDWLRTELGDRYTFKFFSPYSQGGSGDRAQGIAFKTSSGPRIPRTI